MSSPVKTRLLRDFLRLQKDPLSDLSRLVLGAPTSDIMLWNAVIYGPDDSPYADAIFQLTMVFTEDYPREPPSVRFDTKIFHPNVKEDGSLFLDILASEWRPTYDVLHILTSIQALLGLPNLDHPLNDEAALLYCQDRVEYDKRARQCSEQNVFDNIDS